MTKSNSIAFYLLLHTLSIIDEAPITNPGEILHDELRGLCLPCSGLSTHLLFSQAHEVLLHQRSMLSYLGGATWKGPPPLTACIMSDG